MSSPDPEEARAIAKRAQRDPAWWVRKVLGNSPSPLQVQILESVRDNRETAVASCHGFGKSWIAARAALWFLYAFEPSIVITTAPTDRQVRKILWKEILIAHQRANAPLGGRVLQQEIQISPEHWALGFTTRDYDADRFQGHHEDYLLVVVDEAAGVTAQIYDGIKGLLSSAHARKLEIGNPTDPNGPFGHTFRKGGPGCFNISALDTPNFTTFGITLEDIADGSWEGKITGPLPMPKLVTPQWLADAYHDNRPGWGPEGPLFIAKGLGRFPEGAPDSLYKLSWLDRAEKRHHKGRDPNQLALDVARFGDDENVLAHRLGNSVRIHRTWSGVNTMATVGRALKAIKETGCEVIKVDVVGIGAGVYDRLAELADEGEHDADVVEMSAGERSDDPEQYVNLRAQWYGSLATCFEQGDIVLEYDAELRAQLLGIKVDFDSKGRMLCESKKKAKARGVPSPDRADAVAMVMDDGGSIGVWVE